MIITIHIEHIDLEEAHLIKNSSSWEVRLVVLLGTDSYLGHYLARCSFI